MPTLLDLPPELLTRLPSGYIFLLNGVREHDELWREDRITIAALARTCRKLHNVFNPHLYRSLVLTNLPVKNRLHLIRTIASRPQLAGYVEDLRLDFFAQKFPLRDVSVGYVDDMTPEQLNASDGDWYRLLGYMFFPTANYLKQLAIRCTRLERMAGEFPELVRAHVQSYCQGRGIGLDHAAIEQLMSAPKIQDLVLSGPYITDAKQLDSLPPATSNVSTLTLRVVMLSPESLHSMLRLPRNLTSFEFYSASMRAPFLEARTRDKFINFSDIGTALDQQKHNLDTIRISFPSSDAELPPTIFGRLSFHHFSRLIKLSIAPEMFLGWKSCSHQTPTAAQPVGPPDPINFVDCLPHCLEELTVYLQQYQRARNGNGYAYDIVRGILKKRTSFYKLAYLELACCKGVISCQRCRTTALTYLDRSPTVQRQEIEQIKGMCGRAGIKFSWVEGVWEEP